MNYTIPTAGIFVPDGMAETEALARTTHLCIAAHHDDIEIMAAHGALACFGKADVWFSGVVVTNGSGSPRDDLYANYTDAQMMAVRRLEQQKAAMVGEYGAQLFLDFTSGQVKDGGNPSVVDDIYAILMATRPRVVYTHNPADKHDTHVGVTLRTLAAIRRMPAELRPAQVLGCEVWRALDWVNDEEKVLLDLSAHENVAMALLGVFDSQICGGKRYDLATIGRRRANATYAASHDTDTSTQMNFAIDLTPLAQDPSLDIAAFTQAYIERFAGDVNKRLAKLS
jgi:LmbE family N-acetylglucosaminyl deacetylase